MHKYELVENVRKTISLSKFGVTPANHNCCVNV